MNEQRKADIFLVIFFLSFIIGIFVAVNHVKNVTFRHKVYKELETALAKRGYYIEDRVFINGIRKYRYYYYKLSDQSEFHAYVCCDKFDQKELFVFEVKEAQMVDFLNDFWDIFWEVIEDIFIFLLTNKFKLIP